MTDDPTREALLQQLQELENENKRLRLVEKTPLEKYVTYKAILDVSPLSIAVVREGRYLLVNPATCRMLGYENPEELEGVPVADTIAPEFRSLVENRLKKLNEDMENMPEEIGLLRKDGTVRRVESKSVPISFRGKSAALVMGIDVTEQQWMKEALVQSEERYRSLVELLPEAVLVHREGTIVYINPEGARIFRASNPEQMIGRNILDMVHPDFRDLAVRRTKIIQSEKRAMPKTELHYIALDGETIITEATATQITFEGNPSVLAVIRDITEQHHAEIERIRLQAQLSHSQKMEAIGTLAGGIAHDFNNILGIISGYAELALNDLDEGTNARLGIDQVVRASERAKDLIGQILAFGRGIEPERKPIDIGASVKDIMKMLKVTLPSTIDIRTRVEADAGVVEINPTQLQQIVMNLCANAAHAMEGGAGLLEVSAFKIDLDGKQAAELFPGLKPGPFSVLRVSDSGRGIDPKLLGKIFDPYFTTKEKGVGTGMGLSMVHGIVKSLNGAITVESEPGKGSTFLIYFPRVETAVIQEPAAGELHKRGTEHILFVDDEEQLVRIGEKMLGYLGYNVTGVTNGAEALELIREQPDEYDMVMTDLTMPDMPGDVLAAEVMAIRPSMPVVMCTGYSERITEKEAAAMGVRALVPKPLSLADMAQTVRRVLDKNRESEIP